MKVIRTAIGSTVSAGLVKELQKRGVEVIGLDSNPLSYGLYNSDNAYIISKADDERFLDVFLRILEYEQPDAIITGPEEESLILAKNRNLLESTVLLCPSYEALKIITNKKKLYQFLRSIEILFPLTFIIKPSFGRGSKDIMIDQQYIEGDEYSVDILADQEGNTLNIVPRLRMEVSNGKSVKSKTVFDIGIINDTKKIVKELKLFGPSCIQCIKNPRGIYFIDVNPRFGGGSVLSMKADPTMMDNLICLIKGEKPTPNYKFTEGLIMMRYYKEVYIMEDEIIGTVE